MASHLISQAIHDYVEANWTLTGLDRFYWENETPPPDVEDTVSGKRCMIVNEMFGTLYAQVGMGHDDQAQNRWDEEGMVEFHCMVPTGAGAYFARQMAKTLADLFRGARLMSDSLEFRDAVIGVGGTLDRLEGNWWGVTVRIDWRHMED